MRSPSRRSAGHTLVEMLIACALITAMSLASVPLFLRWTGVNVRVGAGGVLASFRLARARAITMRANVYVEFTPDGGQNGRGFYSIFIDKDGDRRAGPGEIEESGVPQPDRWRGRLGWELPRGVRFGGGGVKKGPRGGRIPDDGIAFSGGTNRLGFYPKGNTGIGTVYVTNGRGDTRAVRVLITGAMEGWNWRTTASTWVRD